MSNTVGAPGVTAYAYWLIPAAPAHQYFRETIQRLAADYVAPAFEPHMTLAVGSDNPAQMDLALSALRAGPIELCPTGLAFAPKFTKSLFVRFQPNSALRQLRDSLGLSSGEDFDPHVSLLYHELPEEGQAHLASTIELPFDVVVFDSVVVTRCRLPVVSAADVGGWETVAHRSLGPKTVPA